MNEIYLGAAVLCMAAVLFLESLSPLHAAGAPLRRWARNGALSVLAVGTTLATPLLFWAVAGPLGLTMQGGLVQWGWPVWAQWVLTFLVMESMAYALHRLSHAMPWLWRLHAVHHSDVELDATTTHRHHPLENLVGALLTLPVLIALAPPPLAVLAYSLVALAVATLSHGNLRLPAWLDRGLRWLVVTPAYHRVHHSAHRPQTDSNYATLLPLFDHLFRSATAVPPDGGRGLTMGLERGRDARSQSLAALLRAPFSAAAAPMAGAARPRAARDGA
ncbi:MAG: sterol desaturase family protein [Proteobacteria bacterium]|nr:sterol desaturase family protein [Pseudomonadota bacterium]